MSGLTPIPERDGPAMLARVSKFIGQCGKPRWIEHGLGHDFDPIYGHLRICEGSLEGLRPLVDFRGKASVMAELHLNSDTRIFSL